MFISAWKSTRKRQAWSGNGSSPCGADRFAQGSLKAVTANAADTPSALANTPARHKAA
ncbi:hypothetical protein [Kingella oralis]|uniref:hypothetical protein n=1 Tax=Kingella oralis TaxID=505 RepID=UPI0034E4D9CA